MNVTLTKQVLREYSLRSFYNFFKLFWSTVESAPFVDNWHIKHICNELEKRYYLWDDSDSGRYTNDSLYDLIINLPPGSSKSLIVSVFFPAWVWLKSPAVRMITASYSHKIAEELSGKSLRLMQSDLYSKVSTFKLTSTAVNNLKTSKGGQRFVTSVGGTITGIHADIIICDDINSPQSIYSEADRESTRKFVQEILPSRKTNLRRSVTFYVQQRLHNDDATGYILKGSKAYKHICISAIDYNGNSFFPARFPIEYLNSLKEQLGSISFNAQYLQVTNKDGGGVIKRDWLKFDDIINHPPLMYFVDSAYGGKNADYNAIIGVFKHINSLYIVKCEQNKYEFPELIKWLKENLPSNSTVYIEGKASGKSIVQTLKADTNFNVIELQVKSGKMERKNAVSPYFESGRIIINSNIEYKEDIITQLIFDVTRNDDILDTIMHSIEKLLVKNTGKYNIS